VPLQELTLKHLPAFSAAEALIGATANMAAAAAARAIPVVFLAVFIKLILTFIMLVVLVFSPLREVREAGFPESSEKLSVFQKILLFIYNVELLSISPNV
jgi:hypothetical protein